MLRIERIIVIYNMSTIVSNIYLFYNITIRNKIPIVEGYEINYSNVECFTINKTEKRKSLYIQRIVNKTI